MCSAGARGLYGKSGIFHTFSCCDFSTRFSVLSKEKNFLQPLDSREKNQKNFYVLIAQTFIVITPEGCRVSGLEIALWVIGLIKMKTLGKGWIARGTLEICEDI